jgi:hypothetical protein
MLPGQRQNCRPENIVATLRDAGRTLNAGKGFTAELQAL